tara:strand:+ start:1702 stop:2676 length:975 start_codon:yes stop_codon:yes gene_type:complete
MRSLLKRPMFRRGGPIKEEGLSTMRANFNNGTQPLMPLPKPQNRGLAGFDEKFSMNEKSIRDAMGSPKDTRFLRYLSRAAGNLGNQRGGTALQRISRAMAGDPMEKLFNETDQFRSRNQGIKNAALQRTLGQLDRDEKRTYDEEQLAKLQAYEASQNLGKDNRTASQKDFGDVEEQFIKQGKPIYDENGNLTPEFKARYTFFRTGREIIEQVNTEFELANITGSKRDIEAQRAFNQSQTIKEFHKRRADDAGMTFATVDEYVPGEPLKPFVIYIAEDGVQYGDSMVEGAAYVLRDGDDVKFLDIDFEEISIDNEDKPLNDPFAE